MFKYLLVIQLFLGGLLAHSGVENQLHFFSFLHLENFVLFIVLIIFGLSMFGHIKKEIN